MNSPRGGPPPPPHLCARILGDCHALKACMCRTAVLKAHGEMKAHILATICPDLALMAGNLRNKSFSGECWLGGSKIEAWRLQNHPRRLPNRGPDPPKSSPEPSKTQFLKTFNLRRLQRPHPEHTQTRFVSILNQLGSNLEAQKAPKWRPKP